MSLDWKKIVRILLLLAGITFFIFRVYKSKSKTLAFKKVIAQYDSGNFLVAKSMLLDKVKEDDSNSDAWQFLGTCLIELEQYDSAQIAYTRSLEIDPNNYKAVIGLGIAKRDEGDYLGAAKLYNKALELRPNDANAHSSLVIIELKSGDFKKAVFHGEKAKQSDPKTLGIQGNLMLAYHFNGKYKLRDELIEKLKTGNYQYLDDLLLVVDGSVTLDDF